MHQLMFKEVTQLKTMFKSWWGRSLAIAILLGSGQSAIALTTVTAEPTHTQSLSSEFASAMIDGLELTTWQLVSYQAADGTTVDAVAEHPATFQFQAGQVTGTTGCNRFFSGYSREGDQLTVNPGGSTLMACLSEALQAQETAILTGLPQVASFVQTGDRLQLFDEAGTILFTLMPQPTAELTDTEWTLTFYNNGRGGLVTPLLDSTITATFNPETGLAGSAGCNNYRATYETDNDGLTIGAAASTRRLCAAPEGIMQQESAFLALLENVTTYAINGDQLELKNAEGTTLARFTTTLS
jgi:heat shock protein HslJ